MMADSRFYKNMGPFSLREVLDISECKIFGDRNYDPDYLIQDVSSLQLAGPSDVSFLLNAKHIDDFRNSKAGFCITEQKFASKAPDNMLLLISRNPYKSYAFLTSAFYDCKENNAQINSTSINNTAIIGKNCQIEYGVVIEENVVIGDNCYIGANTVIKKNVQIGNDCKIGSQVYISYAIISDRVTLHPGVKIGQDGFGFATEIPNHYKVYQLGRVLIGNDVEIGSNSCIDRGSSSDTIIGDMCMIDNLVQIAHNVKLGRGCVIVSQVGIAGSTQIGDFSVLGGQVGIAGHLKIGSAVQIAAQSGVAKNIKDKEIVGGSPAVPITEWHRQHIMLKKLYKKFRCCE